MTTNTAARLVSLYPTRWRARYGEEFTHVLTEQPLTARLFVDVLGGAVDAHLHRSGALVETPQGGRMTGLLMTRCAHSRPALTRSDAWRASAVMIGASLALAGAYIWAKMLFGENDLVDAFGAMAFPAATLVAAPFSYLKGTSRTGQAVFIGGLLAFLVVIALVAARI